MTEERAGTIFDMDGVIADTQHIHARVEAKTLASYGLMIDPAEISRRFSGVSNKDMFATLFAERNLPSPHSPEVSDRIFAEFCKCAPEFRGIGGTITRIRELHGRIPLAVASATRPQGIELILRTIGVYEHFTAITSSREVARGKPAPDVFLLAAEKIGIQPKNCVVIEDGVAGMRAAKAAGMRCIALVRGNLPQDLPEVDLVTDDLRKVPIECFLNPRTLAAADLLGAS